MIEELKKNENKYSLSEHEKSWLSEMLRNFQLSSQDKPFEQRYSKNTPILDVGVASGFFIKWLRDKGYNKAVGLDKRLDKSLKNLEGFVEGDIKDLPFENDSFELVTTSYVLGTFMSFTEEFPYSTGPSGIKYDFTQIIDELLRVTKPEGRLIFNLPSINSIKLELENEKNDKENIARILHKAECCQKAFEYLEKLALVDQSESYDLIGGEPQKEQTIFIFIKKQETNVAG